MLSSSWGYIRVLFSAKTLDYCGSNGKLFNSHSAKSAGKSCQEDQACLSIQKHSWQTSFSAQRDSLNEIILIQLKKPWDKDAKRHKTCPLSWATLCPSWQAWKFQFESKKHHLRFSRKNPWFGIVHHPTGAIREKREQRSIFKLASQPEHKNINFNLRPSKEIEFEILKMKQDAGLKSGFRFV